MRIDFDSTYFNIKDTLECGQVFRFKEYKDGYLIFSADKCAYVHTDGNKTVIESDDDGYFYNYFDLDRDYEKIVKKALSFDIPLLSKSASLCRGMRILNQNKEEMIYSFIISQNNNIPRIKRIIEKICARLGEKRPSPFGEYFAFPSSSALAGADVSLFSQAGAGYRDNYLSSVSKRICLEGIEKLENLETKELKKELLTYKGIGPKVADCVALFAFRKTDSFPVDTWIEKVYSEDFKGTLKDRNKICDFFVNLFGEYSGYIQQYLFYGKRLNL